MTALTGETGAGKTLLVEALSLLLGGRADPAVVRAGADEATGRGPVLPTPTAATRSSWPARWPVAGRSKAWIDGRMAPVGALAEAAAGLLELHGQHQHRALVRPRRPTPGPRRASAAIDTGACRAARARLAALLREARGSGRRCPAAGPGGRAAGYQVDEIDGAGITEDDEEDGAGGRGGPAGRGRPPTAAAAAWPWRPWPVTTAARAGERARPAGRGVGGPGRTGAAEAARPTGSGRPWPISPIWPPSCGRWSRPGRTTPARLEEVRSRRQLLHELERKYGADPRRGAGLRRRCPGPAGRAVAGSERRAAASTARSPGPGRGGRRPRPRWPGSAGGPAPRLAVRDPGHPARPGHALGPVHHRGRRGRARPTR